MPTEETHHIVLEYFACSLYKQPIPMHLFWSRSVPFRPT